MENKEITKCEVCMNNELVQVLDLGMHPLCDDLIPIESNLQCEKYPINVLFCNKCFTAHQRYQVPKNNLFPESYHYRSRFTADVLSGMDALVDSVERHVGTLLGKVVLDVGCNDGSLLDKFLKKGSETIGVEPTGAYADAEGRGHLIFNDYFDEIIAKRILNSQSKIDIITFTNVFAHIENLPALLKALRLLMRNETILVVENHYLGAVLERNQFDTFYHEHPRTYSLNSFVHIAQSLDCNVEAFEFPQRYGGNIRVIIGKSSSAHNEVGNKLVALLQQEEKFLEKFDAMQIFVESWRYNKKAEILAFVKSHGQIKAKAFPGRAAILIALLNLSDKEILCVYEKPGSLKIGNYLPGTRIPIRSDEELFFNIDKVDVILNLAWHIPKEIDSYLRKNGYVGEIINIL